MSGPIRQVKLLDLPLRLLKQKKSWDIAEFCRCAVLVTNWYAYVWGAEGEEWAMIIAVDDPIYDSVLCETLIVDKDNREHVPEVVRAAFQICEALAKQLGRKYVTTCTRTPNAYLRLLGNPSDIQRLETRLRKEV